MVKNIFDVQTGKFSKDEDLHTIKKARIDAKPVMPRLEIAGKSKQLSNKIISIGRDKSNHIIMTDPLVSRFHCVISFEDESAYIKDTGSSNGTFVNERKINEGIKVTLNDKDKIKLGKTVLIFRR